MSSKRIRIPRLIAVKVLYKSARVCCVCRISGRSIQIHHINEDPSDNNEENLVVLCSMCHDEAHTTHALSGNLDAEKIRFFKASWEEEVKNRASSAMLPGSNLSQAIWTFINHQRLPDLLRSNSAGFNEGLLKYLVASGVVDESGIPIFQIKSKSRGLSTIYDRFEWDDARRLHSLYSDAIDRLIVKVAPIELGAVWSKSGMKSLVEPGVFAFAMRGFKFKRGSICRQEEDRLVNAQARGIEIQMLANTRHMYGSSALYNSFVGSRFAAVLMLVKNVGEENGNLVISATPLAMGAGFVPFEYHTPHHLRYGWAGGSPLLSEIEEEG